MATQKSEATPAPTPEPVSIAAPGTVVIPDRPDLTASPAYREYVRKMRALGH